MNLLSSLYYKVLNQRVSNCHLLVWFVCLGIIGSCTYYTSTVSDYYKKQTNYVIFFISSIILSTTSFLTYISLYSSSVICDVNQQLIDNTKFLVIVHILVTLKLTHVQI